MPAVTAVVLFTRDLRVTDNPALWAASRAAGTVPLFVLDEAILGSRFAAPNRVAYMREALIDLDGRLKAMDGRLFLRRGQVVEEAMKVAGEVGAAELHVAADWSAYARRREARLRAACEEAGIEFFVHPGVTIVEPGAVTPTGGDHFKVFSPFHRAWGAAPWREAVGTPRRLSVPTGLAAGELPALTKLTDGTPSPDREPGGETQARKRMHAFLRDRIDAYDSGHDDLASAGTSHLGAHLRWGCVSPLELADEARERRGGAPFVRQLCWRDFHHQVLAAFPALPRRDYRPRGDRWSRSGRAFEAWRKGRTGYPLVDAGMRQLAAEGHMHNRARMAVGSFLTKDLYIDWRKGAWHFWDLLSDGEIADNAGNWQWVAGTGNDTRPQRVLNPVRQAERFDPDGIYVRRWVPELASVRGKAIFRPWLMEGFEALDYPEPIVDHDEAVAEFRARRES
ncbi:MAG TPA: deoxyribodipyrimidine photo-lyase [Solirubrobacterales bacterium]|nr:deoxyribodipyrimidine photo-lyase [Solirubrobacterales bacterium]